MNYFEKGELAIPLSREEFLLILTETKNRGDVGKLKEDLYTAKIQKYFAERPALNRVVFCKEAGITINYLEDLLHGKQPFTSVVYSQIQGTIHQYGRLPSTQ